MPVSKVRPRTVMTPGDLGDSRTRSAYRKSGPCIVYKIGEVNTVTDRTLRGLVSLPFDRAREGRAGPLQGDERQPTETVLVRPAQLCAKNEIPAGD